MSVSMEQVLGYLDAEEPNYVAAARTLGADALPHLESLIRGDDLARATKAASLAGVIRTPESAQVLAIAAGHDDATVRVAAAAATNHLDPSDASPVLSVLLDDADAGVRKLALRSVSPGADADVREKVRVMANSDPNDRLRELSTEILRQLG
ncbi:hypothetical protein Cch01nite_44160 [Cellulomonas chitinilytica]|uniref:HEAT repeat domain-containing protein n=1 Tax=Cellulomonas chitinilytica TaxID=398759 RepID=A0A919U4Q8_9CELL|nr:hypothetical protein [Cellulomonas chitinilytica]GIG23692.1 hypothetical protein Cch01nite_44160 [Cellulomonas chitinilytica]